MGVTGTLIVYAIIGCSVGAATLLQRDGVAGALLAAAFWPMFLPLLLARSRAPAEHVFEPPVVVGEIDERIAANEARLCSALTKLEGIALEVLEPEIARVHGLARALRAMAKREREMEELLATPELSIERAKALLEDLAARNGQGDDTRLESVRARMKNIERLAAMKRRYGDELERALLKMEEMSSHMVLLKFADRPESEVLSMIKDIAASVECVAEGLAETA
jgi:DNA repair ATPase RecN